MRADKIRFVHLIGIVAHDPFIVVVATIFALQAHFLLSVRFGFFHTLSHLIPRVCSLIRPFRSRFLARRLRTGLPGLSRGNRDAVGGKNQSGTCNNSSIASEQRCVGVYHRWEWKQKQGRGRCGRNCAGITAAPDSVSSDQRKAMHIMIAFSLGAGKPRFVLRTTVPLSLLVLGLTALQGNWMT